MTLGPFADAQTAAAHYARRLQLETDCADVHAALQSPDPGFVLVDTRSEEAFRRGHVPGAVSIPHPTMTAERMAQYPAATRFVTYCWGPHCNGACKGAAALAGLGYQAKEMLGGVWGWEMEGYTLAASEPT